MCLAIPSRITRIENEMATIDVDGVQRQASLLLLEDAPCSLNYDVPQSIPYISQDNANPKNVQFSQ